MKKFRKFSAALMTLIIMCNVSVGYVYAAGQEDSVYYKAEIKESTGGRVSFPEGKEDEYREGEEVTIEVVPEDGYEKEEVVVKLKDTEEGVEIKEEGSNLTFLMPGHDVEVEATFTEIVSDQEQELEVADPESEGNEELESPDSGELEEKEEDNGTKDLREQIEEKREEIKWSYFPDTDLSAYGIETFAAEKTVHMERVRDIRYNGFITRYFTVNGNAAWCLEPAKFAPVTGDYRARVIDNTSDLAKVMYYSTDAPGEKALWDWYGSQGFWQHADVWSGAAVASHDDRFVYSHMVLSWIYSNYDYDVAFFGTDLYGKSWFNEVKKDFLAKVDAVLALPDPPESFTAYVLDTGSTQVIGGWDYTPTGYARLIKTSANPEITDGNDCYSLKGAKYGVYSDEACKKLVKELTTGEDGTSNTVDLSPGKYYVKEITAPKGYALDRTIYKMTVQSNQTTTLKVSEIPQKDPVNILLGKYDGEKVYVGEGNLPQGSATLAGAEYTFKFYGGDYNTLEELADKTPLRTWVFRTDEDGIILFTKSYLVSGDDFWLDGSGNPTLPLGTVTIEETKAPEGYNINEEIYLRKVTADGAAEDVHTYNTPEFPEEVIRGDFEIIKVYQPEDAKEDTLQGIEGVEFTITSNTTGEVVMTIVTDKEGKASTKTEEYPRGSLVYDTYTVTETKTPEGYNPIKPFTVTISEEHLTVTGIYKQDTLITSPIQVVKVDASTGKTIPVAGTTFQLLDANKNVITMTTHYPATVTYDQFETDENGRFIFPEMLKYGTYYLRELKAPEGYVLNGEDIEFTLTDEAGWDQPLVVKVEDENVMGNIKITKIDSETTKALSGAAFDVIAKEDVVTPDGTVRYKAGEVVDSVVTNKKGEAETRELFLGTYLVKETKAPEGYVLNTTEYEATLTYQDQDTPLVTATVSDIPNKPNRFTITKVKQGTDKKLEGVLFAVWNQADEPDPDDVDAGMTNYKSIYETDANGEIVLKYLAPGTYSVQEIETIPGYFLQEEIYEFTVSKDGTVNGKEADAVTVENDFTKVQISKTDMTTGKELPGAKLEVIQIVNGKETVIESWTSTDKPHLIESLPTGEYILRETTAPNGYQIAQDITFTVEETGEIQKVEMKDEPIKKGTIITSTPENFRTGSGSVRTGDQAMLLLWSLLGVGAVGIVIVAIKRRKGVSQSEA